MRILVAIAIVLLVLSGCAHEEKTVEDSPEEIARQQATIDRINASTTTAVDPGATATTAPPDYEGVDKLRVGDCVDEDSYRTIDVAPIACTERHHAEVTLIVDLRTRYGERFPSHQDFDGIRDGECTRAFQAYTGHAEDEQVGVGTYIPTAESWGTPSSRNVTCLAEARQEGNVLVGSARKR